MTALRPVAVDVGAPILALPSPALYSVEKAPTRLTRRDALALLQRHSACVVRQELDDGSLRVHRLPCLWTGESLLLPTWTGAELVLRAQHAQIECYISELEADVAWRIVALRGPLVVLLPTGDARERARWRAGVDALRAIVNDLPPTEELALENYGVAYLQPTELSGTSARID